MHKKSQFKNIFWEFSWIFTVQHRNLFQDNNFPKSHLTQIRGSSWHKNEIKMIINSYYSSNNFQDSNKRKRTESKIVGYLPRVLFFNAFDLGAERWKSSNIKRSIKIHCRSLFNKTLYCIHISFWRPLVITLWFTQLTKKIFRTDPIKIIFKSFMQS
jgi:hypothetical protein